MWICDKCGADNAFAPLTRREGAYEIGYTRCGGCGAETIAWVSDDALRAGVAKYAELAEIIARGGAGERLIRRAARQKAPIIRLCPYSKT